MPKPPTQVLTLEVDGVPIKVDPMTVTLKERAQAMRAIRSDPDLDVSDEMTLTGAVVWIIARREAPELTLDEVLSSITLGSIASAQTEVDDSPEA